MLSLANEGGAIVGAVLAGALSAAAVWLKPWAKRLLRRVREAYFLGDFDRDGDVDVFDELRQFGSRSELGMATASYELVAFVPGVVVVVASVVRQDDAVVAAGWLRWTPSGCEVDVDGNVLTMTGMPAGEADAAWAEFVDALALAGVKGSGSADRARARFLEGARAQEVQ